MSAEQMAEKIRQFKCKHVVFTGGEPMLQQVELFALIDYLRNNNIASYFEIETNGTILPMPSKAKKIKQWNVSPKSNYKATVENWSDNFPELNIMFKFVIVNKDTLKELEGIKNFIYSNKHHVCFMPEGITRKAIENNSKWLIEECKKLGIRYSTRVQILLWGNKRGK